MSAPFLHCVESFHLPLIGAVGSREGAHLWNSSLSLAPPNEGEEGLNSSSSSSALSPPSPSLYPGSPLLSSLLPPLFVLRQQQPSPEAVCGPAGDAEGGREDSQRTRPARKWTASLGGRHATASRPFQRPAGALLFWGLIPLARLVDAFSDQ